MDPVQVASIVSILVISVIVIIRTTSKSKAEELVKYAQVTANTLRMFMQAAEIAVTDVENDLKKYGDATPEGLKKAAAEKAAELLKAWGVFVPEDTVGVLLTMVEDAYQRLKASKQYHILPVVEQ
jgi:hypothetical protein